MAISKRLVVRQIVAEYQVAGGSALSINGLKVVSDDLEGDLSNQAQFSTIQTPGSAVLADNLFSNVKAAIEARFPGWIVEKYVPAPEG